MFDVIATGQRSTYFRVVHLYRTNKLMKNFLALLTALCLAKAGNSQLQYNWHIAVGDTSWTNYQNNLRDLEIGDSNFVYMAGLADGTPDIDGGTGVVTVPSQGFQTGYIVVNDPAGNYTRSWTIETNGHSEIRNICIAGNNDVIAVGYCSDTTDFDPGPAVYDAPAAGTFIARYSKYGQLIWAHVIPTTVYNYLNWEAVDEENGKICVGGSISVAANDSLDIDPGPGLHYQYHTAHFGNGLLMTLDSNGNYLVDVIPAGSYVSAVRLSPSGEMIATGGVNDTIDFDPGPLTQIYIPQCYPWPFGDFCVMRYSSAGTYLWHYASGSFSSESGGFDLRLDAAGNIYVLASGAFDVDPGPAAQFVYTSVVTKYLSNGQYSWHTPAIAFDLDGNGFVYTYDPNAGLSCFNSAGISYWNMPYGPMDAYTLRNSPDGNIYLGGSHAGGVDYDPGTGVVIDPSWSGASSWFAISLHHIYSGMDEQDSRAVANVYPNPASDVLNISAPGYEDDEFIIVNSLGQIVQQGALEDVEAQINISAFPNGNYFIRFRNSPIVPIQFVVNHSSQ
jgi:hypothetical protein